MNKLRTKFNLFVAEIPLLTSRLSKKEKVLISVAIIAGYLAIVDLLVLSPLNKNNVVFQQKENAYKKEIEELKDKRSILQQNVGKNQRKEHQMRSKILKEELDGLQKTMYEKNIVLRDSLSKTISHIENLLDKPLQLQIKTEPVSLSADEKKALENFIVQKINIQLSGEWNEIKNAQNKLYQLPFLGNLKNTEIYFDKGQHHAKWDFEVLFLDDSFIPSKVHKESK